MIIVSHRGYWKDKIEKNTETAFRRSFDLNFGTETDIRDYHGELVISHDIATIDSIIFSHFCKIYNEYKVKPLLALNIKADGLQGKLKDTLHAFQITNYFIFDMSAPDAYLYINNGFNVFTRQSEFEQQPSFYEESQGIWLDAFHEEWYDNKIIERHLEVGKKVCIVSPELHKRGQKNLWKMLLQTGLHKNDNLILCTDFPEEARRFYE
jgi:glycerophosphoryl diester phosphodiesterase